MRAAPAVLVHFLSTLRGGEEWVVLDLKAPLISSFDALIWRNSIIPSSSLLSILVVEEEMGGDRFLECTIWAVVHHRRFLR